MSFEAIKSDLEFLETSEDRITYLIDLGRALEGLGDEEKIEANRVRGCVSNVWLVPEFSDESLRFRGASDALIVSGIVAALLARVNGHKVEEIARMDLKSELGDLGFASLLSPQRSNGVAALIERIHMLASGSGGGTIDGV